MKKIALSVASSVLVASSFAAKPPNTAESIAPMRAHARIAMTACGIIGIYNYSIALTDN
jgi:hypothetical protein